jgi:NAD(P)-dependent dehydrogenase (short-subunit alcohol dehydrogenase family)
MVSLKFRLKETLKTFINPNRVKILNRIQVQDRTSELYPNNKILANKNVLITGAVQNIGRSTALAMAKQGANIYFTDIQADKIQSLEQELSQLGIISKGFLSDIANPDQVNKLINDLKEQNITIDTLVNSVGIHGQRSAEFNPLDLQLIRDVFETNLFGPLQLTYSIAQTMIEYQIQGSILFLSSIHQDLTFQDIAYSSSKAAIAMTIKELALKLAPCGIRVNGIAPGWIKEQENGDLYYHKSSPLRQSSINPEYIGRAAVYLSADYFSYFTTGTVLKVDNGFSLLNSSYLQPKN